ncbi:serine/threonine protein kinase [Parafrankia sp. EAN1pec]|uniref:serine/threonine-protein kinase n=1 Tax=Parafrankia sp. (strain EAN1pec) TaxID=298653 RepID=UPI0000542282|nr:serine/threonine protein kinase [Frankia sp. EAN1pec]
MMIDRARVAAALPGYELGDQIGAGAFGLVLAGWHRNLHRDVAIKVLSARGHDRAAAGSAIEARLLARFDHPHIIRVHDYVAADDLHLIVTEMMAGGTLTSHQADITQQGACAIGLAVACALSYAHSQGVLHRDIKPDNMLFDTAGLLKVADFGIAKLLDGAAATVNTVIGTPLFMAPEQVAGARLGPATDLYALAVVLYLLLTGTAPFDPAPTLDRATPAPDGVPAPVMRIVLSALNRKPAARPPSAHTFAVDLARAAAHTHRAPRQDPPQGGRTTPTSQPGPPLGGPGVAPRKK